MRYDQVCELVVSFENCMYSPITLNKPTAWFGEPDVSAPVLG
jgi:hypothetical protein